MTEFEDSVSLGAGRGFACVDMSALVLRRMLSICRMNELLKVASDELVPFSGTDTFNCFDNPALTHPFLANPLFPPSHPHSWAQGLTAGLSSTPSV